jgi:hypothetical protein
MATIFDPSASPYGLREGGDKVIQQLTNIKLQQLLQKHQQAEQQRQAESERSRLQSILTGPGGYSQQKAAILANIPTKNWAQAMEYLGYPGEEQQGQAVEQPTTGMNQLVQQLTQQQYQPLTQENTEMQNLAQQGQVPRMASMIKKAPTTQQQALQQQMKQPVIKLTGKPLTRQQQLQELRAQREEARAEQKDIEVENKPFTKQLRKEINAREHIRPRIARQEKLLKSGKLPWYGTASLLKTLGGISHHITGEKIDLEGLEGATATEFSAISKEYLKFIKDFFGSNVTVIDVENYLKTLPDLAQSDEGKWRLIKNMQALGDVIDLKEKAYNDIINENGGKEPAHLEKLVKERIKPQTDRIYDQFINGTYGGNKGELQYDVGALEELVRNFMPSVFQ